MEGKQKEYKGKKREEKGRQQKGGKGGARGEWRRLV